MARVRSILLAIAGAVGILVVLLVLATLVSLRAEGIGLASTCPGSSAPEPTGGPISHQPKPYAMLLKLSERAAAFTRGPVAQLVSAPPCHGGGRGFESRRGRCSTRSKPAR